MVNNRLNFFINNNVPLEQTTDDIVNLIYKYDSTYRDIMNESLKFIEHACPTCCCDGGKKIVIDTIMI